MREISWLTWRGRTVGTVLVAGALGLALPATGEAAGPWQAQVVDAETGQPLPEVAVIGLWHRRAAGHPPLFLGRTGFAGSTETTTDPAGRFTLPARNFVHVGIGTQIEGPELGLFRAGYGGWRFRGEPAPLTGPDAVIEMRPLPTPEARRGYLEGTWPRAERERLRMGWQHAATPVDWLDLPYEQARAYEAAINRERATWGLRPVGIGYPQLRTTHVKPAPPTEGPEAARLRGASAIAIDAAGLRYVADTEHHRIVVFDQTGAMVRAWGRFGREPGAFQYPRGLALDRAGTLYVADGGNHRIQRFTRDGRFLGQFGGLRFEDFDGLFRPTGVAAPATGEIVGYDGDVFAFTPEGQLPRRTSDPVSSREPLRDRGGRGGAPLRGRAIPTTGCTSSTGRAASWRASGAATAKGRVSSSIR